MSDWRAIRSRKPANKASEEGVKFVYEEEEEEDEDEFEEAKEEIPVEKEEEETVEDIERMEAIEKKAKFMTSIKKAFRFGVSAGSMLGGMLGVYDGCRIPAGQKFTLQVAVTNLSRSLPYGLIAMGGFFTIYQLTKVALQNYRDSFDFYNNITGCAVGLLPFIKMPFMKRYIFYPFILFGFDCFGDWKERHGGRN